MKSIQNLYSKLVFKTCIQNLYSKLVFKTEMFTDRSNVVLDRKILFGKITHHLDPEISKMLVKGKFGNEDSTFHLIRSAGKGGQGGAVAPPMFSRTTFLILLIPA